MFDIGCCYESGVGLPRDQKKAVEFFKSAASRGDAGAAYALGCVYWPDDDSSFAAERREAGITSDAKLSVHWLQVSADAGNADGQRQVGVAYLSGVSQRLKKVINFFR